MGPDRSDDSGSQRPKARTGVRQNEVLVLSRISAALSGLWDLDAILGVGLDCTLEIMNGTIGEILFIDEETQTLVHRVYRGYSKEFVEKIRLSLGEGITGVSLRAAKPSSWKIFPPTCAWLNARWSWPRA